MTSYRETRRHGFATRAIHAGQAPDATTGAVVLPIHLSSTFIHDAPGEPREFEYSRTQNPTRAALETCLASLEGGEHALAFASGCAAITAVLSLLSPGDHLVATSAIYGGSFRLFKHVFAPLGIGFDLVDATNPANVRAAIKPKTRMLWMESPTNPTLSIIEIRKIAAIARKHGLLLVVDNTFATPYLQRPLELGADIVVESCTKYFGGHSDLVGGACIVKDAKLGERLAFYQNAAGAVPSPFDCWLILRGTRTLAVRMERHCENAMKVAKFLEKHPRVAKVYYPGLSSHCGHSVARRQMLKFGGMVSFEVKGTMEDAKRVTASTRLFLLAESLGGVESLIEHPATMTHKTVPREDRVKGGLTDSLIRLSVGIEDASDLIADLRSSLGLTYS
jgi:cystathionine beta-lyase/cystathionine gamma-synthase